MQKPFLAALLLLSLSTLAFFLFEGPLAPRMAAQLPRFSFVQRVIDGDTVIMADGRRVRLIGLDAPERNEQCFAEAKRFLHSLVSGKAVEVAFDAERRDAYGRLLAYLFVDGNFVNLAMVKEGYAVAFPFEPNLRYAVDFSAAEALARSQRKGCIWASSQTA
jgi:micrococcal nuclease